MQRQLGSCCQPGSPGQAGTVLGAERGQVDFSQQKQPTSSEKFRSLSDCHFSFFTISLECGNCVLYAKQLSRVHAVWKTVWKFKLGRRVPVALLGFPSSWDIFLSPGFTGVSPEKGQKMIPRLTAVCPCLLCTGEPKRGPSTPDISPGLSRGERWLPSVNAPCNAAQDTVCFFWHKGTSLPHAQLGVYQDPQVFLRKAPFQPGVVYPQE